MTSTTVRRNPRVRRTLAAVAALAVGALVAAPMAAQADSASPAPSTSGAVDTFTVGISQDVDSLNPFTGVVAEAYEMYQLQYPVLTGYSASDFSAVPGLAESWTESPDHSTWTYKIRSGLTWTDGQPLTSADVAYTFNRILKGEYEKTNFSAYTSSITSVTAPDATTVVMKVNKPSPIMLHPYVYILPEHIWKNVSEAQVKSYANEPTAGAPLVGAGPFSIVERKANQYIRLQANPNFFGGAPHFKNLVFRIFNNNDALGQALKKGEVDYVDSLSANVYNSLAGTPGVTQLDAVYSGFSEFAFNTGAALSDGTPIGNGNPALKDPKLRVALAWAVDRKALVDKVYNGYGTVGDTIIPPLYQKLHYTPTGDEVQGFDPEKAKTLLDAAGYKAGTDGTRTGPDGKPLNLRVFGRSDSETSKKSVEFLQGYFKAVGVGTTLKLISSDALTEEIGKGNFDIFEWGWVVEPDPNYQLSTMLCSKRSYKDGDTIYADLSDSFYCNPAYDKLNDVQSGQTNPDERANTVKQMQKLVYDEAPYIVYANYDDTIAYRSDKWTGFIPQPADRGALLFQYGVWSYTAITPVTAESGSGSSSSGANVGLIAGIAALVLLIGGGAFVLGRRGSSTSADDKE